MSYIRKIKKNGKTYLAEVKSERIDGKVIQKFIRYIGKEIDGKQILSGSISDIQIESVKVYGQLVVINELAKSLNLHQILGKYSNEILSLVYAHCVEPKSINQMTNWFKKTDLNYLLNLNDLTEYKLLKALDSIEEMGTEKLQLDIYKEIIKKYNISTDGLFYDVTNTYLYGKKCILGKRGKSKQKQNDKPLIQIGLAIRQTDGIPIFHRIYNGNIHDSKTFQDILSVFNSYKIKNVTFIFDRGITAKSNINRLKHDKLGVICGIPKNLKIKKLIKELNKNDTFVDIDNRIKLKNSTFYVISKKYSIGNVSGKLLICFNNKMKQKLRESRYDEISNAKKLLQNNKKIKSGLEKYFDKNVLIKKRILKNAEEFDGFSCIFTTKCRTNPEKIIKIYFEKDLVEKAFKSLNGIINLHPIRHWLYDRVTGHIFICYLSYLILSLLKFKLNKAKIDLSPISALRELESLYKVYLTDERKGFKLDRVVKLSKIQEKIIRAVNKQLLKV